MPVIRFAHYNLRAPRPLLDALRDFYVQVVGLRQGERPPFRRFGYWLYAGEQAVLHLAESNAEVSRDAGGGNSFAHAAFACSDLAGTERHLANLGIPYRRTQVPETGEQQLFLQDPAGNGVELIFAPGRHAAAPHEAPRRSSGW